MKQVVVTRPAQEAQVWVQQLQALGIDALAWPLIEITAVHKPALVQAVEQARQAAQNGDYDAIMVVSGNAAEHFFTPQLVATLAKQTKNATRVWAPGPGTASQLRSLGLAAQRIDQPATNAKQFDSEALWQVVSGQIRADARVLIVRGSSGAADNVQGNGRNWLAERITAAGAQVDFVAAYERSAPAWNAAEFERLRALIASTPLWLLSSSEALSHLASAMPDQNWSASCALATHPRIADTATRYGFGQVRQCRPTLADVAASIKSEHERR